MSSRSAAAETGSLLRSKKQFSNSQITTFSNVSFHLNTCSVTGITAITSQEIPAGAFCIWFL